SGTGRSADALRVCADPNNLPFSNNRGEGFENRIAALIARDLGARVEYTWWAQRRGFVRTTLNAGSCDGILGVPTGYGVVRSAVLDAEIARRQAEIDHILSTYGVPLLTR